MLKYDLVFKVDKKKNVTYNFAKLWTNTKPNDNKMYSI